MNKQPDVSIPRPVSSKKSSLKHSGGNKNGGKDSKGDKEKGEKEKDKDKGEGSMQRAEREREREREREKGEQLFPTLLEVAVELACSQVGGVYVHVCVCVREREECVRVRERGVCMCERERSVYVREREECICVRERGVYMCVCLLGRHRESERVIVSGEMWLSCFNYFFAIFT
jgi:hypothetical protein